MNMRAGSSSRAAQVTAADPGSSPGPLALPRSLGALGHRGLRLLELAEAKPHGDRLRYLGGCRCAACRRANTDYENARRTARKAGDWNGVVDAAPARAHLLKLGRLGIGRRAVAAATDIADTVLQEIRSGKKPRIRARTERKILAVTKTCASDGALVSARRTWRLIGELLDEGYTKQRIARELGSKAKVPALQVSRDMVLLRTAHKVEVVHRRLTR